MICKIAKKDDAWHVDIPAGYKYIVDGFPVEVRVYKRLKWANKIIVTMARYCLDGVVIWEIQDDGTLKELRRRQRIV